MVRVYLVMIRPVLALLCLSLCLSSPLLAQRTDRAVIGGVVTDVQDAATPGATVTVSNEVSKHVEHWGKMLGRLPVLVQLDPTGELVATVDQESGKPDEWTAEVPWLIRLARAEESR